MLSSLGDQGGLLLQHGDGRQQGTALPYWCEQMHLVPRKGLAQVQGHDLSLPRSVQQDRVRENTKQIAVNHHMEEAGVVGTRCGYAWRRHPADSKGFMQHVHGPADAGPDDGPRGCLQFYQ